MIDLEKLQALADEAIKPGVPEVSEIPPKPDHLCRICGGDWYWPGDYYIGKKRWLCQRCQPPPAGYAIVDNVVAKAEGG